MSEGLTRRGFLRAGITSAAVLPFAPSLVLAGCGREGSRSAPGPARSYEEAVRRAAAAGSAHEVRLIASPGEIELGAGRPFRSWLYNGAYPGPDIRVREGDRLRVTLDNRLPEGTTIHWHGVPVPNPMDGVPGVTQEPVPPGGSFVYDFAAAPAGTYMYHSHAGLQLDRGLLGALIVEEARPEAYDREYTLVLDDILPGAPPAPDHRGGGMMGGMMRGRNGGSGMMGGRSGMPASDSARPDYAALTINGRPPEDPSALDVRRGDRVRLRIVNPAAETQFRFAIAGHRLSVTHADGRPVEPVAVDALIVGAGERYDALLDADNPGAWTIAAESLEGSPARGRAILRYTDAGRSRPAEGERPERLDGGRLLALEDLVARGDAAAPADPSGRPDRVYDLTLSGGMMMRRGWSIDGERYPDAPPLEVEVGERVEVRMTNMSMAHHPMHLHGHFFRVGRAFKDTVLVPPHMGRRTFAFVADNPGDWFFHCHNLYHMEGGMARVFRYRRDA